ncbi:MAG: glycosyltransferase [Terrimicrobiaceae bacterium]|nr:glycosyltransferase [Terrimicrobiaceae bacterium]
MKRLLVVSHPCATTVSQRLFAAVQECGEWEVTLVVPNGWKDEFGNALREPPHPALASRFWRFPVFANGNIILHGYLASWGKFLRQHPFDVIYVHNEPYAVSTFQVACANARMKRPSAFGFYSAQNIAKSYPPPFSWMEAFVHRTSSFAFPVSRTVADVLGAKTSRPNVHVCPLPVDPALYRPFPEDVQKAVVPRSGGEIVIGYVGRLVEAKGLRTLAGALGLLRDQPWKLVVVGRGEFEREFRRELETANVLSKTAFAGYIPHEEAPKWLSAMDVLVVPSETQPTWKEQFGRVIVEAWACGTAVIGSDSGEIPHLIAESRGGLVFPERDAGALAARIREMIADAGLRHSSAENGRAWVEANLDQRIVARRMADVFGAVSP